MNQKPKKVKQNPIQPLVDWWKKIDSEKRVLMIIIVIVFVFIMSMPKIYKGWVNFRDNGFHFGSNESSNNEQEPKPEKDPNAGKTLYMTCTQSIKDSDYETTIKTVLTYVDNQLKAENYTMTMTAVSDIGKTELPVRKALYDVTEQSYLQYKGFTVKSVLEDQVFTFNVVTNYAQIDRDTINKNAEYGNGAVTVDLMYNQNIDSVKSYYEDKGLTCKK